MSQPFLADSYDTPAGLRNWSAKVLGNFRFNFYFQIYYNFYRIACCARRGEFDQRNQAVYSRRNIDVLERCGARIHLSGLNHLSEEPGPFVLAGNHMSSVETVMLNALVSPRLDFTFVIKRSLFHVPFMGHAMRAIDAIGVTKENPREDFKVVMTEGKKRLERGCSVLIFPESTRYPEFRPERFNTIAVKLARSAGVKVIPFALKTDFITPGKLICECGPLHLDREIHFEFGSPIAVTGNGQEAQQELLRFIGDRCRRWSADAVVPVPEDGALLPC